MSANVSQSNKTSKNLQCGVLLVDLRFPEEKNNKERKRQEKGR